MKFYCHAYPNPLIEGVRFKNHYAEVTDQATIDALIKSPMAVVVETAEVKEPPKQEEVKEEPAPVDYEEFTVAELRQMLKVKGIEFPPKARKDLLIKLLEEAK